jgi:hypothetical protein
MLARPTATTDRIGSSVACSSVLARGFMAFADADSIATILAVGVSGAVVLAEAAASLMAVVLPAARLAAGSEAALEVSMAAEDSTVEAAFTAAVPTGVDTGNWAET